MGALGRLDLVTTAFSEAAVDASRWDAAMEVVAKAADATGAALFPLHGLSTIPQTRSLAAAFDTYVRDGWSTRDERNRGWQTLARQGVVAEFDFTTPDEIKRHPYYQEFLAPHGLRWFAGVKVGDNDGLCCLSIQRTIEQGPFSPTDLRKFALLSTHLSGAAELARALGFARAEAALAAFETSGCAIVLLDGRGDVMRCNTTATRLFGPDLQVFRKRLVSWHHEATSALDRALNALLWKPTSAALLPPVRMPRRQGRPYLAYPLRLAEVSTDLLSPCRAIILIIDLEERSSLPEDVLRISFGLSSAEAKLAQHVVSGESPETIAGRLGIAYETARNQLKSVFAKTGTHRQSELVALLTRFLNQPVSSQ